MKYFLEKVVAGTGYWVVRQHPDGRIEHLKKWDDIVKAEAYKERMERGEKSE